MWSFTLLLSLLSFWPAAVDRSVELVGTHRIITGPGFYLVALFLLLTSLTAFYSFVKHTVTLHGSLREQALAEAVNELEQEFCKCCSFAATAGLGPELCRYRA